MIRKSESVPEWSRYCSRTRGGTNERELLEMIRGDLCVWPFVNGDIQSEIFHSGIQELFDIDRKPVDFVDKQHVVLAQVSEHTHKLVGALKRRPGRCNNVRFHPVRDDVRECCLAKTRWPMKKYVLQRFMALLSSFERDL